MTPRQDPPIATPIGEGDASKFETRKRDQVEAEAIRTAARHLAGHHCPRCGRQWLTGASIKILMHQCTPPARRGLAPAWSREAYLQEDREAWARKQLGDAIEEAVPEDDRLRRTE